MKGSSVEKLIQPLIERIEALEAKVFAESEKETADTTAPPASAEDVS